MMLPKCPQLSGNKPAPHQPWPECPIPLWTDLAPTDAFWYAHLHSRQEIFVVCNEPVVFRDYRSGTITRYINVNTLTADRRSAELQLKTLHEKAYDEALVPSYFYLYSGEILAADEIQRWFLNYGFERLERRISRLMPDNALTDSSPILLGNSRVNRFVDAIFSTKEGRELAYQISQDQFGITAVRNLDEHTHEQAVIDSLEDSIHYEGNVCYLKDDPQGDVFVLVTRLPNPFSNDPNSTVTILSCDYTRALEQVALILTTDRFLSEDMKASAWPEGIKVARAFQVLYAVRMGTSNIEATGRKPRFITARGPKEPPAGVSAAAGSKP